MSNKPTLNTTAGAPVADNQNSITAGPRGPVLLQDYQMIEKLAQQYRERTPERTVHAKGQKTGNVDVFYEPNSFGGAAQDARFAEPPLAISGDAARYNHRDGNDDYRQGGDLFRLMTPDGQQRLFRNIAEAMAGVPETIIQRQLGHFYKADPAYGEGAARALGLSLKLEAAAPFR